ncbi:MAG TPA: hypothetical protein P5184_10600 [Bacteroidales bacterium]|nr:hypothetical protein [Bacteroidales bacterium]
MKNLNSKCADINSRPYLAPSKKEFMINYRVRNIEGLVNQLKENGVTVLDEIEALSENL